MQPTQQQITMLAPVALLAALAAIVASTVDPMAMRAALLLVAALAATAAAWFVAAANAEGTPATVDLLPARQVQAIAADRRRPTFDRDTGLHAEWYFRLRIEEEIARARRYNQGFSLLVFSAQSSGILDVARVATKQYLREVDFAGDLGDWIVLCLPNTTRDGAEQVVGRLAKIVKGLEVRVVEYPADGETLNTLLGEDEWRTRRDDYDPSAYVAS
jgi:hypothetical protein